MPDEAKPMRPGLVDILAGLEPFAAGDDPFDGIEFDPMVAALNLQQQVQAALTEDRDYWLRKAIGLSRTSNDAMQERLEGTAHRTFFGLEVVKGQLVRLADIEALPFYDFWQESACGSTMVLKPDTGETMVYLHDWERFCHLFIATGRHRFNA